MLRISRACFRCGVLSGNDGLREKQGAAAGGEGVHEIGGSVKRTGRCQKCVNVFRSRRWRVWQVAVRRLCVHSKINEPAYGV